MRYILLAAHAALVAVACREVLSSGDLEPSPGDLAVDTAMVAVAGAPSPSELEALDEQVHELMMTIGANDRDVEAMTTLAHLYMRHAWWDQAIGPLARAVAIESGRDDLWHQLQLALELSGLERELVDLGARARAFAETAATWGHGC